MYKCSIENTMQKPQVPTDFCKQILKLDKTVRFAGIADRFGEIIMAEYRKDVIPLLPKEEATLYAMQSTIRMGTRKAMQTKLGKLVYAFAQYEKIKSTSILLSNQSILMVSFDVKAKHEPIIMKKIMTVLKRHRLHWS